MVKLMYFLTGNAPGFKLSEKTVMNRCNISESGYKKARRKLADMGWIFYKPGGYIQVNFNKIFSDYKNKTAGCSEESRIEISSEATKVISNPNEDASRIISGITEESSRGIPEDTYNNINNTRCFTVITD